MKLILGALLFLPALGRAAQAPKTPFSTLKTAERFTLGKAGFAGTISTEEKALRTLLREKKAGDQFAAILSSGTQAGQLYALLGLKLLNDVRFDKAYPGYAASKDSVSTMNGCLVEDASVEAIVRGIRSGKYKWLGQPPDQVPGLRELLIGL